MIVKNESTPDRVETQKELLKYDSSFKNINLSDSLVGTNNILDAGKKICRELLSLPRHGALSAVELERRLCLPVFTFGRALHELAKRGLVTIKGSIVKANRRTESVLEDKHD